jgi:hypothetical protein
MDIDTLRVKAQHKLSLSGDQAPFNREQIRRVLAKAEPLTEADVAQLKHFVDRTTAELSKTIYYGNTIIDPATWNHVIYKRSPNGEYRATNIGKRDKKSHKG